MPSVASPRVKGKRRAQTRGKLKGLRGQRGSMANREIFRESLMRENALIGKMNLGLKKKRKCGKM